MRVCPKCRKEFTDPMQFCNVDGAWLVPPEAMILKCVICNTVYADGSRLCPRDGGQVLSEADRRGPGTPFHTGRKWSDSEIEAILARDYQIQSGALLRRGWELFKRDAGAYIGFYLLLAVLSGVVKVPFLGAIAFVVAGPALSVGVDVYAFKSMERRPVAFSDFFKGFNYLLPLCLGSLLRGLFVCIGFLLLLIPGIYLSVGYVFVSPLILEKKMDFSQALGLSRKMVRKHWWEVCGFLGLLTLINLGGACCLLIGLLVTIPWSACAMAAAYEAIFKIDALDY